MGLDNGIILKQKEKIEDPFPPYIKIDLFDQTDDAIEYEICYWRKCPGLRAKILSVIPPGEDDYAAEYELDTKTLEKIRDVIYEQLKNPEDWWSPIWGFEEIVHHLARDIVNITWLIDHISNNTKSVAYFYDSY